MKICSVVLKFWSLCTEFLTLNPNLDALNQLFLQLLCRKLRITRMYLTFGERKWNICFPKIIYFTFFLHHCILHFSVTVTKPALAFVVETWIKLIFYHYFFLYGSCLGLYPIFLFVCFFLLLEQEMIFRELQAPCLSNYKR